MDKIKIIRKSNGSCYISDSGIESINDIYNRLSNRIADAESYFDNKAIGEEEKEKHIPQFEMLLKQASAIINYLEIVKGVNHE